MRLSVFGGAVVAVIVLGAATVYGAVELDDALTPDPGTVEVLVATEDIPACSASDEWAEPMELVWMDEEDVPVGALKSTDVLDGSLLTRNLTAGDVIKAQDFGNYRKEPCVDEAG
jgi:hypothetical protein